MKLRLTHNSIRIRIQRSELARLREQGRISESIEFPSKSTFQYEILILESSEIEALFEENKLLLILPNPIAKTWIDTNQVGIETQLALGEGELLHVLIEKDFPCADRPDENKSEKFEELVNKPDLKC